jgi:hypothetical protein
MTTVWPSHGVSLRLRAYRPYYNHPHTGINTADSHSSSFRRSICDTDGKIPPFSFLTRNNLEHAKQTLHDLKTASFESSAAL